MSRITTHVLDTARGRPAAGVRVRLERLSGSGVELLGQGSTDDDGRLRDLVVGGATLAEGSYRLVFDTATYFAAHDVVAFYPQVAIDFDVSDASQHYHVPLLLSPFGYSTYRGS